MVRANIGAYFEIPVVDMERAINFYESLLETELERGTIHEYEMAFFPYEHSGVGISGALAKGDVYKPSIEGLYTSPLARAPLIPTPLCSYGKKAIS